MNNTIIYVKTAVLSKCMQKKSFVTSMSVIKLANKNKEKKKAQKKPYM